MEGWIKLHRQLLDSTIFQNERLLKLWIWILMRASHEGKKVRLGLKEYTLSAGEFVFGYETAKEELNMPVTTLHRFMDILKREKRIGIKVENKKTIVTIENWGFFQCGGNQSGKSMENQWKDNGKSMETNKNVKNYKNINNNTHIHAHSEEKFQYADYVWLTTDQYNELEARFGKVDADRLIAILDNHKRGSKKEYADDYRAIFSWCVDRLQKNKNDGVYQDDEDDDYLRMLRDMYERKKRSEVKC